MAILTIITICILAILFEFESHRERQMLQTDTYSFSKSGLKKPLRFVFLSDLHEKEFGPDNEELFTRIAMLHPDFILLGGDLIICRKESGSLQRLKKALHFGDTEDHVEHTVKFLRKLKEQYRVYCGIGNHELRLLQKAGFSNYRELCTYAKSVYNRSSEVCTDQENAAEEASARAKLLELYEALDGITVLDNASIRHGELLLTGITLPMTAYKKLLFRKKEILPESLFQTREMTEDTGAGYRIAMVHNPIYAREALHHGQELVLSGHVHGGTIRLPWIGALMTPQMMFFFRECAGCFSDRNGYFLVNRGLGTHSINIRWNDLPEISLILLEPTENDKT